MAARLVVAMVRLKCPNCANIIDAPAGTAPTCPACGFRGAATRVAPGTPFSAIEDPTGPVQRPGWVVMVAVFQFIGGGGAILGGLLLATIGGSVAAAFGSLGDLFGGFIAALGIVLIVLGVLEVLLGTQVLRGREWARILSLVLAFIGAAGQAFGLMMGNFFGVFGLAIDVLIIVGLMITPTRLWFAQQSARPATAAAPA